MRITYLISTPVSAERPEALLSRSEVVTEYPFGVTGAHGRAVPLIVCIVFISAALSAIVVFYCLDAEATDLSAVKNYRGVAVSA